MKRLGGWPEVELDRTGEPGAEGRDRRTARRIPTRRDLPLVLLAGDRVLGPPMTVRCVNISTGGMRLEGPAPLLRGGRAAVQMSSSDSVGRRAIIGLEVVYSHVNYRGDYDAGVRFVRIPEEAVRANFVDQTGRLIDLGLDATMGWSDGD